jgi:phospholipid/cholesterol/gamma-HCH transport system substrate-binding protein
MVRQRSELWVGLTVLAGLAVFLYATFRIGGCGLFEPSGRRFVARFNDASGVELRTNVTIAGVRVGEVEEIVLEQGRARLMLRIDDPEVALPIDSLVTIRSRGLLGERMVEITPGSSDQMLDDRAVLTRTFDAPNVDRLLDRLVGIADDMKQVARSLRLVLGGPEGEASMAEIVENIRAVSSDLRRFVEENESRFVGIVENLEGFSAELVRLTEDNSQTVEELLANLRSTSERMQHAVETLSVVGDRIARGEGTLGKLVQDQALYDQAQASLEDLRAALREVRQAAEEAQEQLPVTVLGTVVGTLF